MNFDCSNSDLSVVKAKVPSSKRPLPWEGWDEDSEPTHNLLLPTLRALALALSQSERDYKS